MSVSPYHHLLTLPMSAGAESHFQGLPILYKSCLAHFIGSSLPSLITFNNLLLLVHQIFWLNHF
jgi:hypothetical protein